MAIPQTFVGWQTDPPLSKPRKQVFAVLHNIWYEDAVQKGINGCISGSGQGVWSAHVPVAFN